MPTSRRTTGATVSPSFPPTFEKVNEYLKYTDYAWDEVIATLPPAHRSTTTWHVAVNAVMSGCKPEYMPILIALTKAMGDGNFRRRGAQIAVCVVMALLFGILHVRNFPGAFISALFYGMVFIWSRNIWYSVALHAGSNLTSTLLAVYCWLGLGEMQMAKTPVIILPDWKVIVASLLLAIAGVCLLKKIFSSAT